MGGMNVLFVEDGGLVTPPLSGTILPGITRDSLLTLARDLGLGVREYAYSLDELTSGVKSGKISEAIACGTAAVATGIRTLCFENGSRLNVGLNAGLNVGSAQVPGPRHMHPVQPTTRHTIWPAGRQIRLASPSRRHRRLIGKPDQACGSSDESCRSMNSTSARSCSRNRSFRAVFNSPVTRERASNNEARLLMRSRASLESS